MECESKSALLRTSLATLLLAASGTGVAQDNAFDLPRVSLTPLGGDRKSVV